MPRYPNVWFHVDTALAPSHRDAVKLVTDALRDSMRLREYFPPFDNPEVREQAVFWLGQSKDPRALAFFERILTSR